MANAVIYARFSSHSQREESIEGQLKACCEYAKANGLNIVGEYVDRAKSARSASGRTDFLRMIKDSAKGCFEIVLVYQLDRLARSRYDSAVFKGELRTNGVRVVSAKESISDTPEGIITEGLLESLAEYYSADLARKIKRGQQTNAEHAKFNGGMLPLGYTTDEVQRYRIDEVTAPIVRVIFERYAAGATIKDIVAELNEAGVRTRRDKKFAPNSLQKILRNRKYAGYYIYGDIEVPGGMPYIIEQELFDTVQRRLETKRRVPSSSGAFLLTSKLFCGRCCEMMVGDSGTSRTGKQTYYYYSCKTARKRKCAKKSVRRERIEALVVDECRNALTDENMEQIASKVSELCEKDSNSPYVKSLEKELNSTRSAIDNLIKALECGEEAELILGRIKENRVEGQELEARIAEEKLSSAALSEPEIRFFLESLRSGLADEENHRKTLVQVFVNKVYLYDDKLTTFFNTAGREVEITKELQEVALSSGVRMERTALHHEFSDDGHCPPSLFNMSRTLSSGNTRPGPRFSRIWSQFIFTCCILLMGVSYSTLALAL